MHCGQAARAPRQATDLVEWGLLDGIAGCPCLPWGALPAFTLSLLSMTMRVTQPAEAILWSQSQLPPRYPSAPMNRASDCSGVADPGL